MIDDLFRYVFLLLYIIIIIIIITILSTDAFVIILWKSRGQKSTYQSNIWSLRRSHIEGNCKIKCKVPSIEPVKKNITGIKEFARLRESGLQSRKNFVCSRYKTLKNRTKCTWHITSPMNYACLRYRGGSRGRVKGCGILQNM